MRPEGAFLPDGGEVRTERDADTADDVYRDAISEDDVPLDERPASNLTGDAGEVAVSPLVGDYWMRADIHARVRASQLGLTVSTTTDSTYYSLITVRQKGDALELRDWQCTLRVTQRCETGCRSIATTLLDASTSGKAFMAPRRRLTVDPDGHWSVAPIAYAIGWKGDYTSTPAAALPRSEDDGLVYDPDGAGKGINLVTKVQTSSGFGSTCEMRVLQKVAVTYEGQLEGGALKTGSLADFGSDQVELSNSCTGAAAEPSAAAPSTVRLVPAPSPIDNAKVPWPCPSLSEFEGALSD